MDVSLLSSKYICHGSFIPPVNLFRCFEVSCFGAFVKLNLACVFDFSLVSIKRSLFCGKTVAKVIESKIVGVLSLNVIRINLVCFKILLKP